VDRRGKLRLPAPQLSEAELGEVARLASGGAAGGDADLGGAHGGGAATRLLLGAGGETPALGSGAAIAAALGSARTPAAGTGRGPDRVATEARAAALERERGYLIGRDAEDRARRAAEAGETFETTGLGAADWGGVAPARDGSGATPHPLAAHLAATSGRAGGVGIIGATPRLGGWDGQPTPSATPSFARGGSVASGWEDEGGAGSGGASGRGRPPSRGGDGRRISVANVLAALPAPRSAIYSLAPPEPEEGPDAGDDDLASGPGRGRDEDAADIDARRAAAVRAAAEAALGARSAAVRRGLPRPVAAGPALTSAPDVLVVGAEGSVAAAGAVVSAAVAALVADDGVRHPVPSAAGGGKKRRRGAEAAAAGGGGGLLPLPDPAMLDAARLVIEAEAALRPPSTALLDDRAALAAAFAARNAGDPDLESDDPRVAFLRAKVAADDGARRAAKAEKRLGAVIGGLRARHDALASRWEAAAKAASRAELEAVLLADLQTREAQAGTRRVDDATARAAAAAAAEAALQERHLALDRWLRDARIKLAAQEGS